MFGWFLLIVNILIGIWVLYLSWKNPFNVGNIISICLVVFYIFPIIIVTYFDSDLFSYPFSILGLTKYNSNFNDEDVSLLFIIIIGFIFGTTSSGLFFPSKKSKFLNHIRPRNKWFTRFGWLVIFYIALLIYVTNNLPKILGWLTYKIYLKNTFSPFLIGVLVEYFPAILAVMFINYHKRITWGAFCLSALSMLFSFLGGGRANLISIILLISCSLFLFVPGGLVRKTSFGIKKNIYRSLKVSFHHRMLLGVVLISSVPVFWWIRGRRRAIQEVGWSVFSDIGFSRSFSELLFGSGASGGASFILLKHHVERFGFDFGAIIFRTMTMLIPRSLWGNKPVNFDTEMQLSSGLLTSPSFFLINELYYSFYLAAPIASFLIGYLFSYLYCRSRSGAPTFCLFYAILFSYGITIYKKGILSSFSGIIVLSVCSYIVYKILFCNKRKRLPN